MLPVMIVRFYMGWFQMLLLDLPLIIASFWSISVFYVMAHRELYPEELEAGVPVPAGADGRGRRADDHQCASRARSAVRISDGFRAHAEVRDRRQQKVKMQDVKYRRRSGWLPYAELAVGTYFVAMIAFAIDTFNFFAIPFLVLFVAGYYWAGFSTLYQEWQGKLEFERARRLGHVSEAD